MSDKRDLQSRLIQPTAKSEAPQPATGQPTKPDMIDRLGDWMERNHSSPGEKWGAGHVGGMWRQGLKELAQALEAFPGQGMHLVEEPGVAGNATNIEIVRDKADGATAHGLPPEASPLDKARQSAREASQDKGKYRSFDIG